ncbi:MAG: RimJ/RimL family protein N-acetyltransferase [Flavobacterium sp.]|jgi:RimJ/RimL family protein N-acetyltransferase
MNEIEIVRYKHSWLDEFANIAEQIRGVVCEKVTRIDHIGSTSIEGLAAKDVIDIQISVSSLADERVVEGLASIGYEFVSGARDSLVGVQENSAQLDKRFLRQPEGQRRIHIHVREEGRINQRYPLASGSKVSIRNLALGDLGAISEFEYSVSITEPHSETTRLVEIYEETAMWLAESGAVAIVENESQRMVGTLHYYQSAPCIHGFEIGYVVYNPDNRSKGYAAQVLRLFSDLLFSSKPNLYRQQLIIEVWNTASWKVAERGGFLREGVLRSFGFGDGDPADCFVYSRTLKDYSQTLASSNGPK